MSSCSSVRYASGSWSRPGGGRCRATYRMPLRGWSNGEPTSRPFHAIGSSPPAADGQPPCGGRPHWTASGPNEPPSASVAEVSATVRWANSRFRRTRPTSSGATRSAGGRRESSANGRSSQTTSPRSVISSPNASRIRLAVRCSSSSEASVTRADAIFCGSSSSVAALAWIASRHAPAASCTEVRVAASVSVSSSSRPAGASPRSMASAAAAWRSRSATSGGAALRRRRTRSAARRGGRPCPPPARTAPRWWPR